MPPQDSSNSIISPARGVVTRPTGCYFSFKLLRFDHKDNLDQLDLIGDFLLQLSVRLMDSRDSWWSPRAPTGSRAPTTPSPAPSPTWGSSVSVGGRRITNLSESSPGSTASQRTADRQVSQAGPLVSLFVSNIEFLKILCILNLLQIFESKNKRANIFAISEKPTYDLRYTGR